jgi:hypothetical protein
MMMLGDFLILLGLRLQLFTFSLRFLFDRFLKVLIVLSEVNITVGTIM